MATQRTIKNRIRATQSIKQITRAMEAVSAVKMRKSQATAISARPYALSALEILRSVRKRIDADQIALSPFLNERPVSNICVLVITSDKGLCGAFNSSVIKKAENFVKNSSKPVSLITVGKKGRDYFKRRKFDVIGEFTGHGDFADLEETEAIFEKVKDGFLNKQFDEVYFIYANFISALRQETIIRKILPFTEKSLEEIVAGILPERGKYANMPKVLGEKENVNKSPYKFEPSPIEVLEKLLPALLHIEIHHAILEGNASEHSSRMIAMRNARDNAEEFIGELTLSYNKARQAQITKELTEITGGASALEN
ncbi:MAG: ATP synthase F1 subunit gamma [Candidatus Paceibacterota bacterium]|jgi:F-type H+-transporting ATPase subunit gamma